MSACYPPKVLRFFLSKELKTIFLNKKRKPFYAVNGFISLKAFFNCWLYPLIVALFWGSQYART